MADNLQKIKIIAETNPRIFQPTRNLTANMLPKNEAAVALKVICPADLQKINEIFSEYDKAKTNLESTIKAEQFGHPSTGRTIKNDAQLANEKFTELVDSIKDITARNPHAGIFEFSTLLLNPDSVQHPTELVLFVKRTGDEKLFAVLCSNIGDIRGENGIYTLIRYPLGYNPIKDNYLSTDGKTNEVFPALVKLTSDILNYPDFSI